MGVLRNHRKQLILHERERAKVAHYLPEIVRAIMVKQRAARRLIQHHLTHIAGSVAMPQAHAANTFGEGAADPFVSNQQAAIVIIDKVEIKVEPLCASRDHSGRAAHKNAHFDHTVILAVKIAQDAGEIEIIVD